MIERRIDHITRKRVSQMSAEEMRSVLLTSEKTGIPNRRAFDEAGESSFVAMADVNGLKGLNDRFGYSAGDELIYRFSLRRWLKLAWMLTMRRATSSFAAENRTKIFAGNSRAHST